MYSYLLTIDVLIIQWHGGTTLRFILGGSDDQYNASEIKLSALYRINWFIENTQLQDTLGYKVRPKPG